MASIPTNEDLKKMIENIVKEEVEPFKGQYQQLKSDYDELNQLYTNSLNENCELREGVEDLLNYIDKLEKETYFYCNSQEIDIKKVIDELIYKVKVIRAK